MSGNVTAPAFFFERSEAGLGEGEGRLAEAEREAIVHIICCPLTPVCRERGQH